MSLLKSFVKSRNSFKVTFEIPQESNPDNEEVRLLGDFNDWNWHKAPSLVYKKNQGYKVTVELEAGNTYEYRYLIGESYWVNDGNADAYKPSSQDTVDNCVVILDAPPKKELKKVTKKVTKSARKSKSKSLPSCDFTKVEGIGPKISQLIVEAGIGSFEELAATKASDIKSILALAGKRYLMHDPTSWPKQSGLLAKGKLDELKKLQKKLKGGR